MQINDSWKVIFCAFLTWMGSLGAGGAQTQEAPESVEPPLQITSDGANRYEGGIYYAKDNVVVTYGGDVLMADEVHFNPQSKEATAKGNVRLYMLGQIYRGDLLTYNFRTKKMLSEKFRFLDGKMIGRPRDPWMENKGVFGFNLSWGQDDCRKLCRVFRRCALFLLSTAQPLRAGYGVVA